MRAESERPLCGRFCGAVRSRACVTPGIPAPSPQPRYASSSSSLSQTARSEPGLLICRTEACVMAVFPAFVTSLRCHKSGGRIRWQSSLPRVTCPWAHWTAPLSLVSHQRAKCSSRREGSGRREAVGRQGRGTGRVGGA